jgi:glutamine amidotransferase
MKTVLIDYGAGNLRSAAKALERAAAESGAASVVDVVNDAASVRDADRVVLPGVGAFADCMAGVMRVPGLRDALEEAVIQKRRPFLGICVGMQLMAERGLEFGEHKGFGWLKGDIARLTPSDASLKIPHMGWNQLDIQQTDHPLLRDLSHPSLWEGARGRDGDDPRRLSSSPLPNPPPEGEGKPFMYFVHSYHWVGAEARDVLATTDYGGPVVAMIGRDNIAGTQFHPEKSQQAGLQLLANFLRWRP